MTLSELVKLRFLGLSIIVLITVASPAVLANQDADDDFFRVDDELSRIDPPVTCLGFYPCEVKSVLDADQVDKVMRKKGSEEAERVLEQVYAIPEADKRFLYGKLSEARGFAIFPEVRKSGVMAAVAYGKGIMSFRDQSWEWSPPILLHMQGTTVGPQMAAESTRVIFIFDKICDIRDFLTGHHHLVTTGSDTSIQHVGHPEPESPGGIIVYTVSSGVTMGLSVGGYSIHIDEEANAALYGVDFKPGCIVEGGRSGFQAPWFVRFMKNMRLPPGQPHSTTTIK